MRWLLSATAALLVAAVVVTTATSQEPRRATAPGRLIDTGLYVADQPGVIAPENRPFSPQYPLWTDGAAKHRWVYFPPGAQIDASTPTAWDMPVGTKFWKHFEFNGRTVETRFIWRAERDHWVFATYVWNTAGTDAVLAPDGGLRGAADVGGGKQHTIPSAADCLACHGTTKPGPLGFNALQLSPARDPNALHGEPLGPEMLTLQTLLDDKRLSGATSDAYKDAPRIATNNPGTRTALGYLVGNCGHCHNGRGEIAALGPILRYEELLRDADAVAASMMSLRTKWQVPGRVDGSLLVDTHSPDQSALLVRLRSRSPSSQMPPLGTVVRDAAAVQQITDWITGDLTAAARRSHR
jgi:hypothetical protein